MPRKKKTVEVVPELATTVALAHNPYFRNHDGLLNNFEYYKDSQGFIDWRRHIKPEHVVLNRTVYAKEGIDVMSLSPEEIVKYKAEAPEEKLLIKLAGFKDVARLRGMISATPVVSWEGETAVCHYTIHWIGNYETNGMPFSGTGVASASPANVSSTYLPFLASVASNRAFSRAVRESLCIHIVGADEVNENEKVDIIPSGAPRKYLAKYCEDKKITVETVIKFLNGAGFETGDWKTVLEIPDKFAISAIELLKQNA